MRCLVGAAIVVGACFVGVPGNTAQAGAEIVIAIDKSKQRMTVLVDGVEQHVWRVSTGLGGGPPSGTYRPAPGAKMVLAQVRHVADAALDLLP
jgi:hypothetical protein